MFDYFAYQVMSREEANRLSSQRREQLRNLKDLENTNFYKLKNMFPVSIVRCCCCFLQIKNCWLFLQFEFYFILFY